MKHRSAVLLFAALMACAGDNPGGGVEPAPRPNASLPPQPAWELPPPPIAEGPIVPGDRVHRSQLDNGVELFLLEDHSIPRLELGWASRGGAGSESETEVGITVLLSSVMEQGAGDRDALALAQSVERLGATLSVSADWDSATASIAGLSEDRDALFEILADVVIRPRIEAVEVQRAREQQLAALESIRDDPSALVGRELDRVLYGSHRYGTHLAGSPATVAKLDRAALREWHRRLFNPAEAILFAVGDIDVPTFEAQARAHFGAWAASETLSATPPVPATTPVERRVVVIDRPDLAQAQIAIAHEGISRSDEERVAASLMNSVLGGGGFLSRLMSRVRAKEGLTYSIYSGFYLRSQPGPFAIRTFTQVDQVGEVVAIVLDELEAIRGSRPPTAEELDGAKRFNAGRFALGLETSSAIAASLIDLDLYRLPTDSLDTYRARVRAVTLDEAAVQAQRRLHPERVAIVVAGPAETVVKQLEGFGTVEVVDP